MPDTGDRERGTRRERRARAADARGAGGGGQTVYPPGRPVAGGLPEAGRLFGQIEVLEARLLATLENADEDPEMVVLGRGVLALQRYQDVITRRRADRERELALEALDQSGGVGLDALVLSVEDAERLEREAAELRKRERAQMEREIREKLLEEATGPLKTVLLKEALLGGVGNGTDGGEVQ